MIRSWTAVLGVAFGAVVVVSGCAVHHRAASTSTRHEIGPTSDPRLYGIEVVSVHRSAAGTMLDVRYKILDSAKAAYLVDRRLKPYLIQEATGARLQVPSGPTVGPLRQTLRAGTPPEGRVLFVLFANPGRAVREGDRVSLVIGDFRAEGLIVE